MRTADVLIIGAGTIGTAIAWYLKRKGLKKVILTDRLGIGGGNTSLAASMITQARTKPWIVPFILETLNAIKELKEEYDDKLPVNRTGCIHISSTKKSFSSLGNMSHISNQYKIQNDWLSQPEILERIPWLKPAPEIRGLFYPDDVYTDAYLLAGSYSVAAQAMGAIPMPYSEVTGLLYDRNRVSGVVLDREKVSCAVVVDSAGVWSNLVCSEAGINLPMSPVRSIYWITSRNTDFYPAHHPMVILPDANAYTRPDAGTLLYGIRDKKSTAFDPRFLPQNPHLFNLINQEEEWDILMNEGWPLLNYFKNPDHLDISCRIDGLSTYTPDHNFVIGRVPGLDGFYAATGCSGAGVAASGGFGRMISEMIHGDSLFADSDPHRPDRFGSIDPYSPEFLIQCSAARASKREG